VVRAGVLTGKEVMRTVVKTSPFDRRMKLEAELNKVCVRILKLIDSIRAHEMDTKRHDLDERKHIFAKQRAKGEFNFDPDTGEIIDRKVTLTKRWVNLRELVKRSAKMKFESKSSAKKYISLSLYHS